MKTLTDETETAGEETNWRDKRLLVKTLTCGAETIGNTLTDKTDTAGENTD